MTNNTTNETGAARESDGPTLLVVEDEPGVRDVLKKALSAAGYRVLLAETGEQARSIWQAERGTIRVVLTDEQLPDGLRGSALAAELLKDDPTVRIILMSGYAGDMMGSEAPFGDACRFLGKPFSLPNLYSTVSDALAASLHPFKGRQ